MAEGHPDNLRLNYDSQFLNWFVKAACTPAHPMYTHVFQLICFVSVIFSLGLRDLSL
jgi:hypothetical protein